MIREQKYDAMAGLPMLLLFLVAAINDTLKQKSNYMITAGKLVSG